MVSKSHHTGTCNDLCLRIVSAVTACIAGPTVYHQDGLAGIGRAIGVLEIAQSHQNHWDHPFQLPASISHLALCHSLVSNT